MTLVPNNLIYCPIMKAKLGEFTALSHLPDEIWGRTLPVLVVPPTSDFDHEAERPLTINEQIRGFGPKMAQNCGKRPVAVDGLMLEHADQQRGRDDHPLTGLFQRARSAGAFAIPVFSPTRSPRYKAAVRRIVEMDRQGAVMRLWLADLMHPNLAQLLEVALTEVGCQASETILLLDLQSRTYDDKVELADLLADQIARLPLLFGWKHVFLGGSEFPDSRALKKVPGGSVEYFRRGEWLLSKLIQERTSAIGRPILYSDYGIETPIFAPVKPGFRKPSVHLRYTTDQGTLVAKSPPNLGASGIGHASRMIMNSGHFSGDNFSYGDLFIARAAAGGTDLGYPPTWRAVGTSHHIVKVVRDLVPGLPTASAAPVTAAEQPAFAF